MMTPTQPAVTREAQSGWWARLDGLNHLQARDRTYNGFRLAGIVEDYGTDRLGINPPPQPWGNDNARHAGSGTRPRP